MQLLHLRTFASAPLVRQESWQGHIQAICQGDDRQDSCKSPRLCGQHRHGALSYCSPSHSCHKSDICNKISDYSFFDCSNRKASGKMFFDSLATHLVVRICHTACNRESPALQGGMRLSSFSLMFSTPFSPCLLLRMETPLHTQARSVLIEHVTRWYILHYCFLCRFSTPSATSLSP